MPKILLTGAGFSRNWGGWLAVEAFEYLLGCSELIPRIQGEMWNAQRSGGGFEQVYQNLNAGVRGGTTPADDFSRFHKMVEGMFHTMQIGFQKVELQRSVIRFLAEFDEIYTLNQDTLLELKYFPQVENTAEIIREASNGRFFGVDTPGMVPAFEQRRTPVDILKPHASTFTVKERHQPYYKLHGSSNWISSDDNGLMLILGGDKERNIRSSPLLQNHFATFETAIAQPNTKLMIVGYSFGDDHVNGKIFRAAQAGTRMFIVDPKGTDLIEERGTELIERNGIHMNNVQLLKNAIIGASRRNLTYSLDSDEVERTKFSRFLGDC